MGNQHSKSENELNEISRDVNSLRNSLKLSRNNLSYDRKQSIVQHLANQSSNVEKLKGKVKQKNVDQTLKNISNVMTDILSIDDTTLDSAAIESNSFVHVPINQRQSSSLVSLASHSNNMSKSSKKRQSMPRQIVFKSGVPTLREIESKINDLKVQIQTAIANKDTNQLRVLDTTIKVMSGDLEMIRVEVDTPLEERKNNLMKKLGVLYHKVTKALNQLKKDEINHNLSAISKKEISLNNLSDIEIHLAEYESLLDRMLNDKNATNFSTVRSNISKIGEKLSQIDIVDIEIKEKVAFFSHKVFNMLKTLDNVLAKKEFDSRLNQAIHNYDRIMHNFKQSNTEKTINSLQKLRESIQNIKETNDTKKNQKKDLLAKINQDILKLDELIQQKQLKDKEIVKEIVEENVILRRNPIKSTDKEYTLLDNFYNYWNNVKNNFNIDEYSDLSLFRLDSVLEEMETEINNIRLRIATKCDTSPNRLSRKYSQSVPVLDAPDPIPLQPLTQKIVKAKAKIYNLSSPELSKIEEYSDTRILNRFSKIQEIKSQVDYISEKIDDCIDKGIVKSKLERFLKNVQEYTNDENRVLANNSMLLSNQINELLYKVYDAEFRNAIRYLGIKVQCFNGTKFNAEYNDIKGELIKIQNTLNKIEIPLKYRSFQSEKDQLLHEINFNLNVLEGKVNNSQKKTIENNNNNKSYIKSFEEKLQQLNDKVHRFSGPHKGILYNQIERDLNKLLLDIDEHMEDKATHDEFTRSIEKLLNILEQRAACTQSFKSAQTTITDHLSAAENKLDITKIKDSLREIKTQTDKMSENDVEGFTSLQTRLDLVNVELNQISTKSNENLEKEKEILINEISTLKIVVDAKVALGRQRRISWPANESPANRLASPKNDIIKKLEIYEKKFQIIKNDIEARRSNSEIQRYYQLSEEIEVLKHELDYLNFIRGTDLYIRKSKLLGEMQYYLDLLEKETKENAKKFDLDTAVADNQAVADQSPMAKELEILQNKLEASTIETRTSGESLNQQQQTMENFLLRNQEKQIKIITETEKKVELLKTEVNSFVGTESDTAFFDLDDSILNLFAILKKVTVKNPDVQEKKEKLLKELHLIMQTLDERALETEDIMSIEEKLKKASMEIDKCSIDDDYRIKNIKQVMENIKKTLQNMNVNNSLMERKNDCMDFYSVLSTQIYNLEKKNLQEKSSIRQSKLPNYSSVARKSAEGIKIGNNVFIHENVQKPPSASPFDDIVSNMEETINQVQVHLSKVSDIRELPPLKTTLNNCMLNLNQFYLPPATDSLYSSNNNNQQQFQQIYVKINDLKNSIESFHRNSNKITEIENEMDTLSVQISNPWLNAEQLREIDEKLINFQTTLGKINDDGLKVRRDACMMRIILNLKNLNK